MEIAMIFLETEFLSLELEYIFYYIPTIPKNRNWKRKIQTLVHSKMWIYYDLIDLFSILKNIKKNYTKMLFKNKLNS